MDTNNPFQVHDQTAADYDRLATEYGYCFADALFGLCFEYLLPGCFKHSEHFLMMVATSVCRDGHQYCYRVTLSPVTCRHVTKY